MKKPPKPPEPPHVSCEVCLKEVPKSEARISEAQDYVLYFCGIDCYEKWEHGRQPDAHESE